MSKLATRVGRFIRDRIFGSDAEISEAELSEYLYQREEIALRSLQESLRTLRKYQKDRVSL